MRERFGALRLPRGDDAGAGVRRGHRPRAGGRAARGLPALRRRRPGARAAARPDDPGRAPRGHPDGRPPRPGARLLPGARLPAAAGGRPRASEQRQAGVELVGADGPGADAEALALLVDSLGGAGLEGLASAWATSPSRRRCWTASGRRRGARRAGRRARVAQLRRVAAARARGRRAGPAGALCWSLPALRGGAELLERISRGSPRPPRPARGWGACSSLVAEHGAADAVVIDLGVHARLAATTRASSSRPTRRASGRRSPWGGATTAWRGASGAPRPAVGLRYRARPAAPGPDDRRRRPAPPRDGVVLVGGLDEDPGAAAAVRRGGLPVVASGRRRARAEALAAADGWRYVARPGAAATPCSTASPASAALALARLEEVLPSPG